MTWGKFLAGYVTSLVLTGASRSGRAKKRGLARAVAGGELPHGIPGHASVRTII